MLTKLDSGNTFINLRQSTDINSVSFSQHTNSFFISSFSDNNDFDLSSDMDLEELTSVLIESLNHDPDGYLAFVSNQYIDSFINFATHCLLEAEKKGELNYDNGGVSETFIFTHIDNGIIVELIDPECFSSFFKNFLNEFNRIFSPSAPDFICVELHHIKTNIQYLKNKENGLAIHDILNRNNLKYHE